MRHIKLQNQEELQDPLHAPFTIRTNLARGLGSDLLSFSSSVRTHSTTLVAFMQPTTSLGQALQFFE
jgi:hypothetical protein